MKLRRLQYVILETAIQRVRGIADPSRAKELAIYFIKATMAQARADRFYVVAMASKALLDELQGGRTFNELRKELRDAANEHLLTDALSGEPMVSHGISNSSPPASNTGDGSTPPGDILPLPVNRDQYKHLEEYI